MKTISELSFHLVDLPVEGVAIQGKCTPEDLGLENDDFYTFTGEISYNLRLTPVGTTKDAILQGTASAKIAGACSRCAEQTTQEIIVDDIFHEYENALGVILDLTVDIREDILLALPFNLLCQEDCQGLCPVCGQNLNTGTCDCRTNMSQDSQLGEDQEVDDFRENPWKKLDDLKL